ncbi:hypothetical protein POTOM_041104 [Populus tomentosa]|uniref:Uncharacterized protein n=1 Tax=Populus tomentosa TaxID=118781 RepID=A0A8X8CI92_POPTO|nr:hypothetical protein POTOM_041104 [Populus tomentosa]
MYYKSLIMHLMAHGLCCNFYAIALGMCHVAQATKGEVVALKGVEDKSVIEEVKRILDMARRASLRREVLHTDFLTPPTLKESLHVLEKLADVKAIAQGGYPQVKLNTYRIARNKLGDIILLGGKRAQVLLVPDLVDYIVSSLDKYDDMQVLLSVVSNAILLQVGDVSVSCTPIPLHALEYEPPRTKSFKTVEASLRVDALASAGFKISRSKLVDLIRYTLFPLIVDVHFCLAVALCCGKAYAVTAYLDRDTAFNKDVRVNWTTITKNNTTLKTGDVVSVSGKGRLKIGEINTTRKGKFAVELIHYLLYSRSSTLVQWLKPSEGTIKIKIDGCSNGNPGRSGIGGLLRNGSGNWIIGFSGFIGLSSKVIEVNSAADYLAKLGSSSADKETRWFFPPGLSSLLSADSAGATFWLFPTSERILVLPRHDFEYYGSEIQLLLFEEEDILIDLPSLVTCKDDVLGRTREEAKRRNGKKKTANRELIFNGEKR